MVTWTYVGDLSNRLEEFKDPNDEDDFIHVINYDHKYSGTDIKDPVIINFKKNSEVLATLNPEQNAYLEEARSPKILKNWDKIGN